MPIVLLALFIISAIVMCTANSNTEQTEESPGWKVTEQDGVFFDDPDEDWDDSGYI